MWYFILVLIIVALIASLTNKIGDIDCLKEEKRETESKAEKYLLSKNRLESENNSLNDELIGFRNSVRSIWDFVKTKKSYEKHKGKGADLFLVVTGIINDLEKDLHKNIGQKNKFEEEAKKLEQEKIEIMAENTKYTGKIALLEKQVKESKTAVKTPAKKTTTKKTAGRPRKK